jgi:hypothetical protein
MPPNHPWEEPDPVEQRERTLKEEKKEVMLKMMNDLK